MNKLFTLIAALLVLGASTAMIDAQNSESHTEKKEHKHWPHRGRLRERIHEHRLHHHEHKMEEEKKYPRHHRGRVRERMHERWNRKVKQEKNRNA